MSAQERNFATFMLGDNVYELAGGVIPEIADRLDVSIGDAPSSEALSRLVGRIGANKVLRANAEVEAIDLGTAVDLVERSGVQRMLTRSLWTPHEVVAAEASGIILTGAVANWQDRTAKLLVGGSPVTGLTPEDVYIAVGNREMGSPTEVSNSNVQAFMERHEGEIPTETMYAEEVITPQLVDAGYRVDINAYDTGVGDEITERFVTDHPELFEPASQLIFARVANAGIQMAVQFRQAARRQQAAYDANPGAPQVYVLTDTFPLARTEEQKAQPSSYQSPYTAMRQLALTAKMLHEAGSEN